MPSHPAYRHRFYLETLAAYRADPPACQICGLATSSATVSVDHVVPVSAHTPGTPAALISDPENLRPVHRTCNSARGGATRRRRRTIVRDETYYR